jgi:hypothetical protein
MDGRMIVRFNEYTRYDITQDCEVVRFVGVTDGGSFHTEMPFKSQRQLRDNRGAFKDKVIDLMAQGATPQEVRLG